MPQKSIIFFLKPSKKKYDKICHYFFFGFYRIDNDYDLSNRITHKFSLKALF